MAAGVTCVLLLLAGCTGKRGSLATSASAATGGDTGVPVGDAAVDAVLAGLERAMTTSFTVTYAIARKLGATQATALVSRAPLATSVTIGDIRFVRADVDHTCVLSTKTCEATINDARISDLGLASSFWRAAPARSLRVAYSRRAGAAVGSDETIAGQPAHCVAVPGGTGIERYCSLDAGAVARWDTAYVTVELTSWEPAVRQESFDIPVSPRVDGS